MRRSISLRTYLTFSFGILVILISFLLSIVIGVRSIEEVKSEAGHSLAETAYQMSDKMSSFMWSRKGEIETLSELEVLKDFSHPLAIQQMIEKLKESFPSFSWIGVTDKNGVVIASTQGILKGVDISKRPVFIEGMKGKFVGDVHDAVLLAKLLPNSSGEPMKFVDISVPIYDANGQKQGVLAAHLSWEWVKSIEKSILEPLKDQKSIDLYVVSDKDNVVLLGDETMIGQPMDQEVMSHIEPAQNNWSIVKWHNQDYLIGYVKEFGYMNYEGLGWTVVVRKPLDKAYESARQLQVYIVIVGVLGAIGFSLICWLLTGRISKPIFKLSSVAEALRKGKKEEIPLNQGIKELEMLSVSLRELVNTISVSENAYTEMENVAHKDNLTGISNRAGLKKAFEKMSHSAQLDSEGLLFLCLDLDGFKKVNDTYGHHAGDELLIEIADRLNRNTRAGEIASRLGGDEFVLVLRGRSEVAHKDAKAIAARLIEEINKPISVVGHTVHVGCSVGVGFWQSGKSLENVLNEADQMLYRSKSEGKNRATIWGDLN